MSRTTAPTRNTIKVGDTLRVTRGHTYIDSATITEIHPAAGTFRIQYTEWKWGGDSIARLADLPFIVHDNPEQKEDNANYHTLSAYLDRDHDDYTWLEHNMINLQECGEALARAFQATDTEENRAHIEYLRIRVRNLWEEVYPGTPFSEDLFTRPLN